MKSNLYLDHTFIYFAASAFFAILDLLLCNTSYLNKFKHYPINLTKKIFFQKYFYTFLGALTNNVLVTLPLYYYAHKAYIKRCNHTIKDETIHSIILKTLGVLSILEVLFYYAHRFLHLPFFYRHIHSIHHSWDNPIGVSALFAHPLEHLCSNLLPALLGPFLVKYPYSLTRAWLAIATLNTVIVHSGYKWFSPQHEYHHLYRKVNYGVFGILDKFHATYFSV